MATYLRTLLNLLGAVLICVTSIAPVGVRAQSTGQPTASASPIEPSLSAQLPAAPAGFMWRRYQDVVFLVPAEWRENELRSTDMSVYAASPESFTQTQLFETGFTIQIIVEPKRKRGIEAKKAALVYLRQFLNAHKREDVMILDQKTDGDAEMTFFRFRDQPPGQTPIIVHKYLIANNATDVVHVFTFESPAASWDNAWSTYGTPILSKIALLPNVRLN